MRVACVEGQVDAAVVSFALKQPHEYPPVASHKGFFSMVNAAFAGKRKMLRNSLQHLFSPQEVMAALSILGLPATVRGDEEMMTDSVGEWPPYGFNKF